MSRSAFLEYVKKHFTEDGWSLDACVGRTVLRRFIPKGKRMDNFTGQQISDVETWYNRLPRKVLGYKTLDEIFEEEINPIYQSTA